MNAKDHYDKHLGNIYSWMAGDFHSKVDQFRKFLNANHITSPDGHIAVDLGAGHGIQTIALAECGFSVTAIDFNEHLLAELSDNVGDRRVAIINDDIRKIRKYGMGALVIACCGDTITHLDSNNEIRTLVTDIFDCLVAGGKAIFSFRDYTVPLEGVSRIIPVKSDADKILTCIVDYSEDFVTVTDLLHERVESGWQQKASSYRKVRLRAQEFVEMLEGAGFRIVVNTVVSRLTMVVVKKELNTGWL